MFCVHRIKFGKIPAIISLNIFFSVVFLLFFWNLDYMYVGLFDVPKVWTVDIFLQTFFLSSLGRRIYVDVFKFTDSSAISNFLLGPSFHFFNSRIYILFFKKKVASFLWGDSLCLPVFIPYILEKKTLNIFSLKF